MANNPWSISAIADSLENDIGDFGTHRHLQYCRWALELYRQLNFTVLKEVKTVALKLNAYNAIDYPDDMVGWAKVGVQYGDKVLALGTADDIALLQSEDDCENKILNTHYPSLDEVSNGLTIGTCTFQGWQYNTTPTGEVASTFIGSSVGIPYKGFFTDNKARKQLQFSSNVTAREIYLEYISDGSGACADTVVNPYTFEYLRLGVHWRRDANKKNVSGSEKDRNERLMEDARHQMVLHLADLDLRTIINHVRKGISLNPHI